MPSSPAFVSDQFAVLWSLPVGAVVLEKQPARVYQKIGRDQWSRTGTGQRYRAEEIAGPVEVLWLPA